jgi:hypothetical protein
VLKEKGSTTSKTTGSMRMFAGALLAAAITTAATYSFAADDAAKTVPTRSTDSGTYVKVQLPGRIKLSKVKPGDVVEGTLARDVYAADHELFSAGSQVRLTVDHLERRRRLRNDHWPWVINVFTPRHENFPAFKSATVAQAEGESTFQVSLISVSHKREVHAQAKKNKSGQQPAEEHGTVEVSKSNAKQPVAPVMVLEAFALDNPLRLFPPERNARFFCWAMSARREASRATWCRRACLNPCC